MNNERCYINLRGDDAKRLLELCEVEGRDPTNMTKRLVFLAHKEHNRKKAA